MNYLEISNTLIGIFLVWNTITDIKKREVSHLSVLLFVTIGIVLFVMDKEKNIYSLLGGAAIGVCLLLLSMVLMESVGFGDGLVVLVCGIFTGFFKNLMLLMTGFLLTSLAGILLILLKKANKKSRLPFVPFLTMAYGLSVLGGFM